jgi:RNA polymerase sigma-70 factor (ECF subfamily)
MGAVLAIPALISDKDLPSLSFEEAYERHFSFVWRNVRSLGVAESAVEDVVQDVFMVVHRRLEDFDPSRASERTWMFGILRRVVADHRRGARRKPANHAGPVGDAALGELHEPVDCAPDERLARSQALRALEKLLDTLDDEKREVFVLAELEEMPMPEIAEAIGVNVNTAYARLRAARKAFEQALARHRAAERWMMSPRPTPPNDGGRS